VKKDFAGQLHKFMASLTETAHQSRGNTVLYLPDEDLADPDKCAKDKELVQRLDAIVIHWTRQIKEVRIASYKAIISHSHTHAVLVFVVVSKHACCLPMHACPNVCL
jgi:hypothetical protein